MNNGKHATLGVLGRGARRGEGGGGRGERSRETNIILPLVSFSKILDTNRSNHSRVGDFRYESFQSLPCAGFLRSYPKLCQNIKLET